MICAACQIPNEADARFCEGCGAALERRCAACGTPASATARFCRSCGGGLDGPATPAPESPTRKTVTVLFADLVGSTTFEEKVDAETAREVMGRYHALLRETADRHRAGMVKYIGDGFMAVWGVPEIAVGDADHAVDAAVELQERFVDLAASVADTHGEHLALRVAVNTGEVVVGADDADLVGDALNVAARLEAVCPHGQVVVGEETWRHTRGRYRYEAMSPVQVKGRNAPVAVYQWAGRRSEPADSIPFVGRTHEFRRLEAVLDDAVSRRAARMVTIIGDPGVGKSRLADEFAGAHQDALVLQIRCTAEGTVALAPVVDVLRARDFEADVAVTVPERDRILRDLTGMTGGVAGSVEETFWGLRRYFEVLADDGPLIVILDDIHWADPLLLDFAEHLAEWVREAPILMVALARPELRDKRPELVTVGGWVGDAIRLGGLEPAATAELASRVLGSGRLPTELLARLPSTTGGNPLFVRELVAMLVHDGVLVARDDSWRLTIDVDAIAVPPTIHALLASRLERLAAADRRVLQTAAVIGVDFSPSAVCALSGAAAGDVKAALDRLRQLELAQPSGTYTGDEPVWRFHHILIRDVAYRRLLKSDRAELHERFAEWIDNGGPGGVFESDELVARHLESAHGYRGDLGARDAHTAELALRAARRYLAAARRALDRDALVSAGAQAARGAALAAADAALRSELLMIGCEAYLSAGDVAAGAPLVDELERTADDTLTPWATCYRCQYIVYTDPTRLPEIDGLLPDAIGEFTRRGDAAGLAKAYRVRANARARLGRIGDCESDLFEALIAARKAGDHRQITASLGAAPNAALWGPSPAPKAGGRCLDVVRMQRMTTAAPSLEATSLRCLAVLELLRGRPDKARSMLADAREIVSDLGLRHGLMETELYAGIIELLVGDPVAAEPHFRTALEGLDSLGVGADAGQAAALLARSLLAQGRIDEADRYAAESERIAGHNLKTAIGWRAVRAEILAARGRNDEAAAIAREAVDVAADTDLVLDYADANLALSRVLGEAGDQRGAAQARAKAESLYAAKDAVFLVGTQSASAVTPRSSPAVTDVARRPSRLRAANAAGEIPALSGQGAVRTSTSYIYEDRRKVPGEPLASGADLHAAAIRKLEQYPNVEGPVLAARGERLALVAMRWWDDAGNQTSSLDVFELDGAGALSYHGRFDEDDFASAYVEMEQRYYGGEGKPFAANGLRQVELQKAFWAQDFERAQGVVSSDFCWFARVSAFKADQRSLGEVFAWRAERLRQVASFEDWVAALEWLSPNCFVSLCDIQGRGEDGEEFRWPRILVTNCRDGLGVSCHEFDLADEDAAFAFAESLVASQRRRLVVANSASEVTDELVAELQAGDAAMTAMLYAERFTYDDRRRLTGAPMGSRAEIRHAAETAIAQYGRFENRTLAVRGDRTCLTWSRWADDAGNQSTHLHVFELDDHGLICYEGRFAEDDFAGAFVEFENRYYAREGAPFAANGLRILEFQQAMWTQDVERARSVVGPDFHWCATASAFKIDHRSLDDMVTWRAERLRQVESFTDWLAALEWLSPDRCVALSEMWGRGEHGEDFRWSRIYVADFSDGLFLSGHEFDVDEEEAAFAYAESLPARERSRLVVRNRATEVADGLFAALDAKDLSGAPKYAERLVYDDRRRIPGRPLTCRDDVLSAAQTAVQQYSRFEHHALAVRGKRSALVSSRWSDTAGNETAYLHVFALDDDGLIGYEGRFDADDFTDAYAELEQRYYGGEGAANAESGLCTAGWVEGIGRRDIEMVRRFSTPDFRWIATESSLKARERSVEDMFAWLEERGRQVSAQRHWVSAAEWVSPTCAVVRQEISAVGKDGAHFLWDTFVVSQVRGGLVASAHEFNTEAEAFAFAEALNGPPSRLAMTNLASEIGHRLIAHVRSGDFEAASNCYSEQMVYDDRRHFGGDPVLGRAKIRDALKRFTAHYSQFEVRTLAVRGNRLHLAYTQWSDGAGNLASGLVLVEVDDDGLIIYDGRFDEDDFDSAYVEMERRFYAGQGAAYAEAGTAAVGLMLAESRGDLDGVAALLSAPGLRIESRSRSVFSTRTAAELRQSIEELSEMVDSYRVWIPAINWVSRDCVVARHQREAVGTGGEAFSWSRIFVLQIRHGRVAAACEFDVEQEAEAFAYAEELARASGGRLAVANRATVAAERLSEALRSQNLDLAAAQFAPGLVHEDRRRLSGDPLVGFVALRRALERILQQYQHFEGTPLAVRGDRLVLEQACQSDGAGNEATPLIVAEVDDADRFIAYVIFDGDDFEGAYAELERRYFAGEGAEFAAEGHAVTSFVTLLNRGDLARALGMLDESTHAMQVRSSSVFPDRTRGDLEASLAELRSMVSSVRWWHSTQCWLSPHWVVCRQEREGIGADGERFGWSRIYVGEARGGIFASIAEFDLKDEDQAFAYAEELMRLQRSRLAVSNRASKIRIEASRSIQRTDIDAAAASYAEDFRYEDHRRLSGEMPVGRVGIHAAFTRLRQDYTHFGGVVLAVRGERLALSEYVCTDDAGNQMSGLTLTEIDEDGRIIYEGRFDDGDFESAYLEMSRRYSAGEGSRFAEMTTVMTDYLIARNRGDFDTVFTVLSSPELRIESRSGSVFVIRSAAEHRASLEELAGLVVSVRDWTSAVCPLSPTWAVARIQREAIGHNGENYCWDRIAVAEVRDGTLIAVYDFDLADEDAAFAFAEERARSSASRLSLENRGTETISRMFRALSRGDTDSVIDCFSDDYVRVDRRRILGSPLRDKTELRSATERMLFQFNHFQWRTLAVRGDGLALGSIHWSDDAGNASTYLAVGEVDDNGRVVYEARFDEDDFEAAYGELEYRFYSGEASRFAQFGTVTTDYFAARNREDLDTLFTSLTSPDFLLESRSGSVFVGRSAAEHRASIEELGNLVGSVREWMSAVHVLSPNWGIGRYQRLATGPDGENYQWDRIVVAEVRNGQLAYVCDFDLGDEEAAFAFAEERARASTTRLPLTNRASDVAMRMTAAMSRGDPDTFVAAYRADWVRDDRRRLAGAPIGDAAGMRVSVIRMLQQFNLFEWCTLAVRGTGLALGQSRSADSGGNVSTYLHVFDVDGDGLISYEARFDDDDFEAAYRELERRYFAGEGAAYAANQHAQVGFIEAVNRRDLQAAREVCLPSTRIVSPPAMLAAEDRSLGEFFRWLDERAEQAPSVRHWMSAVHWLSADCEVIRIEIRALEADGDDYTWPRIAVGEVRGGRLAHICQFDVADEEAAFAYAEEIVARRASRLPLTNQSSDTGAAMTAAFRAADVDAIVDGYAEGYVFDDRRRLSGDSVRGAAALRAATERILHQYSSFEVRPLAVRGSRLSLGWTRWSDAAGNETSYLNVMETDDDGRFNYAARFDEDDFEGAYAEMERRYYAGEGAQFADNGLATANYVAVMNRGDFDTMFTNLTRADLRVENRSRSAFPDRSAVELRTSLEQLQAMLTSVRSCFSAVRWLTPGIVVGRHDRDGVGRDGEPYTWSRILVATWRDGQLAALCDFDPDDEDAAFAYAESLR